MRLSFHAFVFGCALAVAACGTDASSTGPGGGSIGPGGGGPGADGGPGGDPGPGGNNGGNGGSDSGVPQIPIIDGNAPPFEADRTGMSGLDKGTIDSLKGGGASCGVQIVYPYDHTVFPVGLQPPPLMWTGGGEAAYVQMEYQGLNTVKYEYAAQANGELRIPVDDWYEISRRTKNTGLLIKLNVKKGSAVSTCRTEWRVAPGAMVGSIYYNTYNLPEATNVGAVVRLTLGQNQATAYLRDVTGAPPSGPCVSCHSVSFDGSSIVAANHFYFPFLGRFEVSSYSLRPEPQPPVRARLADASFGALTPDGKRIFQIGQPQCTAGAMTFPRAPNNFPLVAGPATAGFLDTTTGQPVTSKGLNPDHFMWMPQFSPDAKKIVFNHAKLVNGKTDRRELAVMDYDKDSNTFSNLRVIVSKQGPEPSLDYSPSTNIGDLAGNIGGSCSPALGGADAVGAIPKGSCTGPCYPAWPFFTPDGNGVVYSLISEPDFAVAFPGRDKASKSELWYVDLTTGEKVRLDNANKGLPGEDTQANYYPTVLPVAVGGYYWMYWTSTRNWGTRSTEAPPTAIIDEGLFGPSAREAYKKRLWVSAIRPRLKGDGEFSEDKLEDLSSPPFYLEGQTETGNVRAFAALNPCKPTGNECTSGLDCCTGYCDIEKGEEKGTCVEEVMCSHLNERCETDADCCPPEEGESQNYCVGGYCGFVLL